MKVLLTSKTEAESKIEKIFFDRVGVPRTISYIPSVSDPSKKFFTQTTKYFKSLGVEEVFYCDIDTEFEEGIRDMIISNELIYLSGGPTPYFLQNLIKRNLIWDIKSYAEQGGKVIGASAGALVCGENLDILLDCPLEKEECRSLSDRKGVGLYSFEFWPHYKNETESAKILLKRSKTNNKPILAIDDESGILIDSNSILALGEVSLIENGLVKTFSNSKVAISDQ